MLIGLTHAVSPDITNCEVTFIDRERIDYHLAVQQHEDYCAALSKCGVGVRKLSTNLAHPDSCFVEDMAVVVDELAVVTSMGVASRRGETEAIETELARYREMAHIRPPATIEGGDVLRVGRRVFVGLSRRTNAQGIKGLARILRPRGYDVCPVNVRGSLHLKTACTVIGGETLLANRRWVDLEPFEGYNVLFTPEDEPWAANTLRIGDTIFLQSGFPRTLELVQGLLDRVEVIDTSEFRKAEAGLSCLSIIFQDTV